MNPFATALRTLLLAAITLSLVGGVIATDYYYRHEITRKSRRILAAEGVAPVPESAVPFAAEGDLDMLRWIDHAGVGLGGHDEKGTTALLAALRGGHLEIVDFLLGKEEVLASIDRATRPERDTAVGHALRERDFPMADRLRGLGASLDVEVTAGRPFLIEAVESGDRELLSYLLENGADPNFRGAQPHTAAALAAAGRDLKLLRRLARAGADLDVPGVGGNPLLVEATRASDHGLVETLLGAGADVNIRSGLGTDAGLTPIAIAIAKRDGWMERILFDAGADPDTRDRDGSALLYRAVEDGDQDLVHRLLDRGALPDAQGGSGESALACAIRFEDLAMAEMLLGGGASAGFAPEGEPSPLELAVGRGDMAIAELLVGRGARPSGADALAVAYAKRDVPLLSLLLRAGADPEAVFPGTERRIFDEAVAAGATGTVRTLLAAGADIGDNLWAALLTGQDDLVHVILSGGADPRQKGPGGQDPLDYCLTERRYEAARHLLAAGADPDAMHDDNQSWLVKAVREGNAPLAQVLLDHGARPPESGRAPDGHTLIGWAIAHRMDGVAAGLIAAGIDVDAEEKIPASSEFREKFDSTTFRYHLQSDSRVRPVMMAAAQRNRGVLQALMDAGANGRAYTRKYMSAAGIGAWYGDVDIQQIALLGEVPDPQPRKVIINLSSQRVTYYENGKPAYSTRCSTGKPGYRTPTGEYVISDKHRHHTSTIYTGASMPFFQRFSFSAFGIHQGYVPNYPASHGCIRLPYQGASTLFGKLQVGDYVKITY